MMFTPTILIVDDEPTGCEVLSGLLHNQGYRLLFAASGPEALACAGADPPDLILLDVMMQGMDGFEVCRRLRANRLLAEVPIILITALDDRESRLQGIAAGADDFVTKPFDRWELRLRVQTITRLNRYRHLMAERSRLSWVVNNADDGYLLIDQNDCIRYANPRARLYLGLGEGLTLTGEQTFRQVALNIYRCEPQAAWIDWPHIDGEAAIVPRYLVRPETKTTNALWLQVEQIDQRDSGDSCLLRLRDITHQMAMQQDTWTFHTGVLHKLRTPLASITGGLQLLHDQLAPLNNSALSQMSDIALRGSQRLADQINEILTYLQVSKMRAGGTGCPVAALPSLVAQVAELFELADVSVSLVPSVAGATMVLPRQTLELILIELLDNAHKFHPRQQPHVHVAIGHAGDGAVSIKIGDDGATMPPEQLARAWMPYYQGEKYFTGEVRGMGLGLTMVATQLWSVGGSCRITNQEHGPGVVVTLQVPCALE